MEIEDTLQRFITAELLDGTGTTVTTDEALLASGRLDSLGLIRLLTFIHEQHGVDLLSVAGPDDFESIATIAAAIRRHGGR